ncbi:hypothetical protein GCM10022237_05340 [Nocardioides ginsengisoli]|uniref:Uncharacterized protein n=1 Tax=Nocardioides ginsengisoli TaxID=363868 RepID=A0ABW3VW13_9ACTN
MESIVMNPVMTSDWQLQLSAVASFDCATSALTANPAQGIAARAIAPNAAYGPFAAFGTALVALDEAKRERAFAGMGHRGTTSADVPGLHAWSPPI